MVSRFKLALGIVTMPRVVVIRFLEGKEVLLFIRVQTGWRVERSWTGLIWLWTRKSGGFV